MPDPVHALTSCFSVTIDMNNDLGLFTSMDGLAIEMETETRTEGGNLDFVHTLPVRLKYSTIKLTRPISPESAKIAAWFATMVNGLTRSTAHIKAFDWEGTTVASWSLKGVMPVRWQGPSLNLDGPKVATETLELAHQGFLAN